MLVENVKIPPRSLVVGSPGKAIREVGERHLGLMKWYNDVYMDKTERYRKQGNLESERPD
jgi:carbonic anhydrase/acetyltransferase-like protein (isoleucine patch superfamily)